ncbi:MAG: Imm51 family immunity protein [Actinomycetaceae bacterium]|nr:Imm51 family immunity protein [Actinomycetaceae bacterium]
MAEYSSVIRIEDITSDTDSWTFLVIDAGDPRTSSTIAELGYEPNGYFWNGVVRRLTELGIISKEVDADPEGGEYRARGSRKDMEALAVVLTPYLDDEATITEFIKAADADGFDFDE